MSARAGSRCILGIALCAVLTVNLAGNAATVRADTPPSAWDFARDPAERDRWALHVRVQNLLASPVLDETQSLGMARENEIHLELARAMLEQADAAHSPDLRLRVDLGLVYERLGDSQQRDDMYQRVVGVLAPVLSSPPDPPEALVGLQVLAYAYAHLNRPAEELNAWRRYIPLLTDDRARVVDTMNMGEAEMRLGMVDEALATFREVLRLCGELPNSSSSNSTYVLSLWDLAVALDRSGDPGGALDTAAKASAMVTLASTRLPMTGRWIIARDPAVFFVPAWEREWYLALASAAAARVAQDPRDAAAQWGDAERHWESYVTRATANTANPGPSNANAASANGGSENRDPWLAIARARRDRAHAARAEADKRASKLPHKPPTGHSWLDD